MLHIKNEDGFKEKISLFQREGADKIQIISDFDKTLTEKYIDGLKAESTIALLREGGYLTPDYAPKAFALFDKYHPYEVNPDLDMKTKIEKMQEWWQTHLDLMVKCGMNKSVIDDIISKNLIKLRPCAEDLFKLSFDKNVPFLIFSAGVGDIIRGSLEYKRCFYSNMKVVSNYYKFDDKGAVLGYKHGIVHSFNKNEVELKSSSYYDKIKNRKNNILLGDSLGDTGMSEGMDYDNILSFGFLNKDKEKLLKIYEGAFDAVVLDENMCDVFQLIKKILK